MSKPNFFRFKRKFNSSPGASSAKQAKKDETSKGQTTISKFFLSTKQSSNKNSIDSKSKPVKDSSESSDLLSVARSSIMHMHTAPSLDDVHATTTKRIHTVGLGKNTIDKLRKFSSFASNDTSQDTTIEEVTLTTNGVHMHTSMHMDTMYKENQGGKKNIKPGTMQSSSKLNASASNLQSIKPSKVSPTRPKLSDSIKYTPFEQQIVDLKLKYPKMILLVETGYKYRFFGADAKIASEELHIMANMDHNFLTASIPTHRLHVHVRRLVENGHKVGVVKQTETTALKANSASKGSLFSRQLSAVYTKATLIGEDVDGVSGSQEEALGESSVCSMACIAEIPRQGRESHLCDIGVVIIEPATGEAVFDSFADLPNRAQLEKRLEHTRPVEIVVPNSLSEATERLIKSSTSTRIERVPDKWFEFSEALSVAANFLTKENKSRLGDLPPCVIGALAALLKHLQEFGLSKALNPDGLKTFTTEKNVLQMDAGTVKNLELFESGLLKNKGTLCWTLDHTKTSFGARLLRRWVSQPLRCLEPLLERQEAVTELLRPECAEILVQVRALLSRLPDLERDLTCVLHGKSNTGGFASLVSCLHQLYLKLKSMEIEIWSVFTNEFVETLFTETIEHLQDVQAFQENLNVEAAKDGDKTKLLKNWSAFPKVISQQEAIAQVTKQLDELRPKIAKALGMFSVNYITVSGMEYLIEVKNNLSIKVPADWTKVGSTKQVERWRSPAVVSLYTKLCQHREQLLLACNEAWLSTLRDFSQAYHTHKIAVANLATLDVLMSLAEVSKQDGFCRPVLQNGEPHIEIKNGRHPILTHLFSATQEVVANDTNLGGSHERCMIITGPNMGGKSSYIRQVALLVVMAQVGCYVPAESATISLVDAIYTRMGSRDELHHGRSTLLVELEEACAILRHATPHSLAILDELGRGTSSCDGAALAIASLQHLVCKVACMTLFVTHYPVVMTLEQQLPHLARNYHMAFRLLDAADGEVLQVLTFLYRVERGGAHHSYGLNVARLADIPTQILSLAAEKAQQLEQQVVASSQRCKNFQRSWQSSSIEKLREAVNDLKNS